MAGLVPAIQAALQRPDRGVRKRPSRPARLPHGEPGTVRHGVDGRDKPGHDGGRGEGWRSRLPRCRQASSGDHAGSEASVGVLTGRSLNPVMSMDTSRDE